MLDWSKLLRWGRVGGGYGLGQMAGQALGLASGIWIVRTLSPEDYALYTLAMSILATMSVLSDGGISNAVSAQAGKVWQDSARLGAVIATGLAVRRRFAVWIAVGALPFLGYLLRSHGAGWGEIGLLAFGVLISFVLALSGAILEIPLKLHQAIFQLTFINVVQGVLRLSGVVLGLLALPSAAVAVIGTAFAQLWGNWMLRRRSREIAAPGGEQEAAVRSAIIGQIKRSMPNSIYYCFASQISVYIVSTFGSTQNLAAVGALGRISQILGMLSIVLCGLAVPRYARLNARCGILTQRLWLSLGIAALLGLGVVGAVALFPAAVLKILGAHYQHLEIEVVFIAIGGMLSLLNGVSYNMAAVRGWIVPPLLFIPLSFLSQTIPLFIFDLTTVRGVLCAGIVGNTAPFLFQIVYFNAKARAQDRDARMTS